jgi:hypothetical protein
VALPYGISFHDLHNSKGSYLPNETISCANANAHDCGCEVIYFKHPSPYCKWCISLSINDYDDTDDDSEVEVPRIERFSVAASSVPSRETRPASGKSSSVCLPCHSRPSTAANRPHTHPHQEGCSRRPNADPAVADAPPRTSRLPGRTSSHTHCQEMTQPGSPDYSHPSSGPD